MKIRFKHILLYFIIILTNSGAQQSTWLNSNYIKNEQKKDCIQFQYLSGSNRIGDFKNIFPILFNNSTFECNKTFSTTNIDLDDVVKFLGKPSQISKNNLAYNLNPDVENCFAIFSFNPQNSTLYCIVNGCK